MSFIDTLGELGESIFDTAGDIVGGLGDNFEAGGLANLAKAERIKIENQLAVQKAKDDRERKKEQSELLKVSVYVVLFLLSISLITATGLNAYKKVKSN